MKVVTSFIANAAGKRNTSIKRKIIKFNRNAALVAERNLLRKTKREYSETIVEVDSVMQTRIRTQILPLMQKL